MHEKKDLMKVNIESRKNEVFVKVEVWLKFIFFLFEETRRAASSINIIMVVLKHQTNSTWKVSQK